MSCIAPVVPANTKVKATAILSQIRASLGGIPNVFNLLVNAPVGLDGCPSLSKTLSRGRLTARQRDIVALAIAQKNECQYWR